MLSGGHPCWRVSLFASEAAYIRLYTWHGGKKTTSKTQRRLVRSCSAFHKISGTCSESTTLMMLSHLLLTSCVHACSFLIITSSARVQTGCASISQSLADVISQLTDFPDSPWEMAANQKPKYTFLGHALELFVTRPHSQPAKVTTSHLRVPRGNDVPWGRKLHHEGIKDAWGSSSVWGSLNAVKMSDYSD